MLPPLHNGFIVIPDTIDGPFWLVSDVDCDDVQPLASVTVNVYEPAVIFDKEEAVDELLHK